MTTASMSRPKRLIVLAVLAVVGFAMSIYQTQHFYELRNGTVGFGSFCNISQSANCDLVGASPYAELFLGLPLSSFAAGWFLAVFGVALIARNPFRRREALRGLLGLTAVGALASVVYLILMLTVIKSLCVLCGVVDAINFAGLAIVLSLKPEAFGKHKADFSQLQPLAILTLSALVVSVIGLRVLDPAVAPHSSYGELASSVLNTPVLSVNAGPEFPSIGPANAPITVVEFSDFQCPFCRTGAFTLHSVSQRYPTQVRIVFRNYPLDNGCNRKMERPMHPFACEAARTVVCANKQGKFESVYEALFENQTSFAPGKIGAYAKEAGVDSNLLTNCLGSYETTTAIARDVEEGIQLDIQSTPTFFINGHKMMGAYPPPVWHRIIDTLLKDSQPKNK